MHLFFLLEMHVPCPNLDAFALKALVVLFDFQRYNDLDSLFCHLRVPPYCFLANPIMTGTLFFCMSFFKIGKFETDTPGG